MTRAPRSQPSSGHAPLWEAQPYDEAEHGICIIEGDLGGMVAWAAMWPTELDAKDPTRAMAVAARIVEAVNSYAALVKALEQAEYALRKDSFCDAEKIESASRTITNALLSHRSAKT